MTVSPHQHSPWRPPLPSCVAPGQQPELSELPPLQKDPQEARCKLLHISICPHCPDGETETQKGSFLYSALPQAPTTPVVSPLSTTRPPPKVSLHSLPADPGYLSQDLYKHNGQSMSNVNAGPGLLTCAPPPFPSMLHC